MRVEQGFAPRTSFEHPLRSSGVRAPCLPSVLDANSTTCEFRRVAGSLASHAKRWTSPMMPDHPRRAQTMAGVLNI
jgi:hypothetical protein